MRVEIQRDEWESSEVPNSGAEASGIAAGEIVENSPAQDAPTSARPLHSRLPFYLTRFFGREEETHLLLEQLGANRLVTLVGPGGVGKTRLAVKAAERQQGDCVFVALVELPDAARLPEAVMRALGVAPQAGADPLKQLLAALPERAPLVLILDNAEHLLDAVAPLSLRLLESAAGLRLLITSRQRLDIPGESVFALLPLPLPPASTPPERLMDFAAPMLFIDRAKMPAPTLLSRHAIWKRLWRYAAVWRGCRSPWNLPPPE